MKKAIFIWMLCCISQMALANDKLLDEINTIKKDSTYLYAESTMRSADEASQVARDLLREEILRWTTKDIDAPIDSIKAQKLSREADVIITDRADMKRAFVFIKKVLVCTNTTIVTPLEPISSKDSSLINDTIKKVILNRFDPIKNSKKSVSVIQKIMKAKNFFELKNVMEPLKKSGEILEYGKYLTAKNPADCYLIIYDPAGNIVAWLGKGEIVRKNLKTGKDDAISNYHGLGAIWFTINEQQ